MTKKKRNHPDLEEILTRPWCYYCERDFDDLKILINHQKAKHFKCERCGRRLNTAGGLSVHMSQVHKENLTAVDNALPNRAGLDIEIFGMEGIPEDIVQQHTQRVLTSYHQAQVERQAATGNPTPGSAASAAANGHKKPKFESPSELKKRLAEHKAAKLAAEQGDGSQSGGSTPQTQTHRQASPANGFQQGQPFGATPSYSPTSSVPGLPQQAQQGQVPYGQPPVAASYPPQPYVQPPHAAPFQSSVPGSYLPQPAFSPPPQVQAPSAFAAQPYQPHGSAPGSGPPSASGVYPGQANGAAFPLPVASGSVSLPTAPGLPQRPAFGAPPVNAFQFQQMHQGQLPSPPNHVTAPQYRSQNAQPQVSDTAPPASMNGAGVGVGIPLASSIDDLIATASKQADAAAAAAAAAATAAAGAMATSTASANAPTDPADSGTVKAEDATDEKSAKKEKEKEKPKATRLVYSDNEISPEEKMATLPRYAYERSTVVV